MLTAVNDDAVIDLEVSSRTIALDLLLLRRALYGASCEAGLLDDIIMTKEGLVIYPASLSMPRQRG